jgi:hypothetical protein
MYREARMQSLFDFSESDNQVTDKRPVDDTIKQIVNIQDIKKTLSQDDSRLSENNGTSAVVRIVWFYDDNSFEEYFPKK